MTFKVGFGISLVMQSDLNFKQEKRMSPTKHKRVHNTISLNTEIPQGSLDFKFIRKTEVPLRTKNGIINNLPESMEAENLLRAVAAKQIEIAPMEAYEVFNEQEVMKRVPEIKSMKTRMQSAATFFRQLLEKYKVTGQMHLVQRKDRIFLVGNED